MRKRPAIDLIALTTEQAAPMPEAVQRRPTPDAAKTLQPAPSVKVAKTIPQQVPTAELENLSFKVPPEFRKRFRKRAFEADLKQNELLFAALDAWEARQGVKQSGKG